MRHWVCIEPELSAGRSRETTERATTGLRSALSLASLARVVLNSLNKRAPEQRRTDSSMQ